MTESPTVESTSPESSPESGGSEAFESEDFDFEAADSEEEESSSSQETPVAAAASPAAPVTSDAATPPTSKVSESTPTTVDTPPTPVKPVESEVESTEGGETSTKSEGGPKSILDAIDSGREAILSQLAEKRFALSEAERDEFETSAEVAIPKLAARIYLDAVRSAVASIQEMVPSLVGEVLQAKSIHQDRESEFFKSFPDLTEHKSTVVETARVLRQMNPNMATKEFSDLVVKHSRALLGLAAPQPGTPATPTGGNGKVTVSAPFAPVPSGIGAGATPTEVNPFDWPEDL